MARNRGRLWQRGSVWWIQYYVNGKQIRESTRTEKETEARRILMDRLGRVAREEPILPRATRVCVEGLLDDLKAHYETTGQRTLREAETRLAPLRSFFTGCRVSALSGEVFTEYIRRRQAATVANGTINRELSLLGTALRLGEENHKVLRRPKIHLLKEANPRQGFFEEADFHAVRKRLPEDLQVAVSIMYDYGWRLGEVMGLRLSQVDLKTGTLRLDPGTTKNKDGRVVYLTPELREQLSAQIERVRSLSRQLGRVLPSLFTHLVGCYTGQPRHDFRKAWNRACTAVGLVGMLKHDFRRTAVRNMERAGVPRSVATKITGHKTESVYKRYAIVSDADLQAATEKLQQQRLREATRTLSGTKRGQTGDTVDEARVSVQNI